MPKIVNHGQRRKELLSRCVDLFSNGGFSKLTMREIAKRLNVSTGALYHYFPKKKALIEQVFQYITEQNINKTDEQTISPETFEQRLKLFFDLIKDKDANLQNLLLLSLNFSHRSSNNNIGQAMHDNIEHYQKKVQQILKLPESLALLVFNFLNGLALQEEICSNPASRNKQIEIFRDMLINYLEKHDAEENRYCHFCPFMHEIKT